LKKKKVSDEVQHLMMQRETLRRESRWEEADGIRKRLFELGIEISTPPPV